jgi:L-ascorbate metabolism protein UlaG (beta-lactamase superfamily)
MDETNPMRTKLDLAILPVGNNFTMDVEDAIIAADFVDCDKILYHYDNFGIKQRIPSFDLKEMLQKDNYNFF